MADPDVIQRLRDVAAKDAALLTFEQVAKLRDAVLAGGSRAEVASHSGLSEEDVLRTVAALGTHLSHKHKGVQKPKPAPADNCQMTFGGLDADGQVPVAPGFERVRGGAGTPKDVRQAYAWLVAMGITDEEIVRWLSRKQRAPLLLAYQHVTTLRMIAGLRNRETGEYRLDEIDQIRPGDARLAKVLLQAYYLLETARSDGMDAITTLISSWRSPVKAEDLPALTDCVVRARWVHQARMREVEKALDAAAREVEKGSYRADQALEIVRRRLHGLHMAAQADPGTWRIGYIGDISVGQCLEICRAAGLDTDGEDRPAATQIRTRLADYGLDKDADLLVPLGQRAISAGLEDEFWAAVESRVAGDPAWNVTLELSLHQVSADNDVEPELDIAVSGPLAA